MKVSIIIPIYNVVSEIERCLLSVINQDYENIELLLINDGSIDDSFIVARDFFKNISYKKEVKFLEHPVNKGVSAARNTGILASEGDYLFFLDGDDELTSPDVISYLIGCQIKFKGLDMVVGNCQKIIDYKIDYIMTTKQHLYTNNMEVYRAFSKGIFGDISCGKLVRKDFIKENNLFFDEKICNSEDALLLYFFFKKAEKIYITPKLAINYHRRPGSATQLVTTKSIYSFNSVTLKIFDDFQKNMLYEPRRTAIVIERRRREGLHLLFQFKDDRFIYDEIKRLKTIKTPYFLTNKFSYLKQNILMRLPAKIIFNYLRYKFG